MTCYEVTRLPLCGPKLPRLLQCRGTQRPEKSRECRIPIHRNERRSVWRTLIHGASPSLVNGSVQIHALSAAPSSMFLCSNCSCHQQCPSLYLLTSLSPTPPPSYPPSQFSLCSCLVLSGISFSSEPAPGCHQPLSEAFCLFYHPVRAHLALAPGGPRARGPAGHSVWTQRAPC